MVVGRITQLVVLVRLESALYGIELIEQDEENTKWVEVTDDE